MGIKQQKQYDICQRVIMGDLNLTQASKLIGKSFRQVQQIVARVRAKVMGGIIHGNLGRAPANKTSKDLKKIVKELFKIRYFDFNVTHFQEKLIKEHGIKLSHDTLLRWGHEEHFPHAPNPSAPCVACSI